MRKTFAEWVARVLNFTDGALALGTKPTSGQVLRYDGTSITGATMGGGGTPSPTAAGDMIGTTDGAAWVQRTVAQVRDDLNIGAGAINPSSPYTVAAGVEVVTLTSSKTVAPRALSNYQDGQRILVVNDSTGVITATITPADGTIDGVSSVALSVPAHGVVGCMRTSSSTWGSLQQGDVAESYEARLVGGAWYAFPQAWTGSQWIDVGPGVAATVEAGSGTAWSASGTTLTLLAGLTNTTQPHSAQGKVYWTVADLSAIWSSSVGAVYTIGQDTVSAMSAAATDNGRIGIAMTSATGSFDAASENIACMRVGQNGADSHYIVTIVVSTGSFGSPLLDSTTAVTGARMTIMHRQAVSFAQAQGSSNAVAAQTPPTATATRAYLLFTSANTLSSNITITDPRFRIGRLSGSP